eukprot:TRINITY_DN19420_c0_g1_i1.p1 TRINITY_DN19420_c0_g1~~TRINITY_DN19420_c0_g1_i1.p1  ORF type:complete len:298 (+),score=54.37 TRINITY_DN19420_c0_g1_i1:723-1616(+)
MFLKLSFPFILFGFLLMIDYFRNRTEPMHGRITRLCSYVLFVVNFLSTQLLSSMFGIFNCLKRSSGEFYIANDPSEACFTSTWVGYTVLDVLFIIFYLIIFPIMMWRYFLRCSKNIRHPDMLVLLGTIVHQYREGTELFELFRVFFRFCFMVLRDLLHISRLSKSTLLSLLFALQIWIEARWRPYKEKESNDLSMVWNLVCLLILLSQFIFSSSSITEAEKLGYAILFLLLIIGILTFSLVSSFMVQLKKAKQQLTASQTQVVTISAAPVHRMRVRSTAQSQMELGEPVGEWEQQQS